MRVVRTIVAVMVAATITVTGCTTAPPYADQPAPPPPAPNPTHAPRTPTPRTDPNDSTPVGRQALIYTAVLRQYLTSGDAGYGDTRFPHIFMLDHRWLVPAPPATERPKAGRSPAPSSEPSPTPSPMSDR
jgi:hypothetical protein